MFRFRTSMSITTLHYRTDNISGSSFITFITRTHFILDSDKCDNPLPSLFHIIWKFSTVIVRSSARLYVFICTDMAGSSIRNVGICHIYCVCFWNVFLEKKSRRCRPTPFQDTLNELFRMVFLEEFKLTLCSWTNQTEKLTKGGVCASARRRPSLD
jgi:hypothetical protein